MKKRFFYTSVLIFVIIAAQVIYFNFGYLSSFKNVEPSEISVNNAMSKDLLNEGSTYISTSNDPWLEFLSINRKVVRMKIIISYENSGSLLQIFYKENESESYSEENSKVIQTKTGMNEYIVDFQDSYIQSIRMDVTNFSNEKMEIRNVILNPDIEFTWNTKEIFKNTSIIIIVTSLILLIYKKHDLLIKYRYPIAGILFIILVLLRVHGSSIGIWDSYISGKDISHKQTTLIGTERPIRSDEWLVQTPYMLSQSKSAGFNQYRSELIRSDGQNMVLANAPTYTIETLGKPFYWGYLLLGADYGLAWYWNSKLILLLLLSYEISVFLTKGNKKLSILGSLWITMAPFIQWWYTTGAGVVELIIYSQAIITCAIYYFKVENVKFKITLWGLTLLSVMGFVYTLYPAAQVPLMFLILVFLAALILDNYKYIKITKLEFYFLIGYIGIFFFSLYSFVYNSMSDIHLVLNTIYPGKRTITGGEYPFTDLQLYLMNWLLPFKDSTFSNNSAVSSVFNFFPLILITSVLLFKKKIQNKKIFILLFCYLIFQLTWLFVKYPNIIAKMTLFSFVPEVRLAGITFGLTAVYLSIWFVAELLRLKPFTVKQSVAFCLVIFSFYWYSLYNSEMVNYLGGFTLITLVSFTLIHYFLLKGMEKTFIIALLAIILISGLTVNPIARGGGAIYNKQIAHTIKNINSADPGEKWAATDSIVNGQYLVALGIKSFNSVQYYPDLEMWNKLDKTNQFDEVYNRYAHVVLTVTNTPTEFVLDQADKFTLRLNISDLSKTDIRYILAAASLEEFGELEQIYYDPISHLYIYKVKMEDL